MKNNRILIFVGLPLLLLIGLSLVLIYKSSRLDATLNVQAVPADSRLFINGHRAKNGLNKVRHGKLQIVASRDGFSDDQQSITLKANDSQFLGFVLVPSSPAYQDWYAQHPADQKLAEGISSKNFDTYSSYITATNPLIKSLPYVDRLGIFRVDYGPSQQFPKDPKKVAILISATTPERQKLALDWIKSKGIDPTKLEIIYKVPTNY